MQHSVAVRDHGRKMGVHGHMQQYSRILRSEIGETYSAGSHLFRACKTRRRRQPVAAGQPVQRVLRLVTFVVCL